MSRFLCSQTVRLSFKSVSHRYFHGKQKTLPTIRKQGLKKSSFVLYLLTASLSKLPSVR
jgi:hypothetical protein